MYDYLHSAVIWQKVAKVVVPPDEHSHLTLSAGACSGQPPSPPHAHCTKPIMVVASTTGVCISPHFLSVQFLAHACLLLLKAEPMVTINFLVDPVETAAGWPGQH